MSFMPLETLGPRIVICGPSNAGKSTLARALERKLGLPAVYLELLRHRPNTDWELKPADEFERLHAEAIAADRWAIEGNYFGRIGPRLERATGIVFLGSEPLRGPVRYARRALFEKERAGQIDGGTDRLKWTMAHFIVVEQPKKQARDRAILKASGRPMVEPASMRQLNRLYGAWGLER